MIVAVIFRYHIISTKASGVISAVQKESSSEIEERTSLPDTCTFSSLVFVIYCHLSFNEIDVFSMCNATVNDFHTSDMSLVPDHFWASLHALMCRDKLLETVYNTLRYDRHDKS